MTEFHCPSCGANLEVTAMADDWTRHDGGRGWREIEGGLIIAEERSGASYESRPFDDGYLYRTNGYPSSMEILLFDFGRDIEAEANFFGLPVAWVMATIAIEATRHKPSLHFDATCERYEQRPDDWSAGLMQTMLETAREVNGDTNGVPMPETRHDLKSPRASLAHGCAYIVRQLKRYDRDPVLSCVAAYNAGGVYTANSNPWRLRTYGEDRVDKWLAYQNDAREVLG